ncbi:MAG: hypothetical protein U0V75_04240 [Ferruginibacter sp.]
MNNSNRDLLVLFNHDLMTPKAIEQEVEMLHELLYEVECLNNVIAAHEAIDINRYRIIAETKPLKTIFRQKELQAFVFLNCKN